MSSGTPLLRSDHQMSQILLHSTNVEQRGKPVILTLSQSHILINNVDSKNDNNLTVTTGGDDNGGHVYSLVDVIGSKAMGSTLQVYCYPKQDGCCGIGKGMRKAAHLSFKFTSDADAVHWSSYLAYLLRDLLPAEHPASTSTSTYGTVSSTVTAVVVVPPPPKRYLVFVNPVSGKGQGKIVWKSVEKMFSEAGVELNVVVTTHANHAFATMKIMGLQDALALDCIVIVGGDGLVYEVVNGIMGREDGRGGEVLRKVPLAHVGAGTGNGLCKSILFECGEEYSSINASFVSLKGRPKPLDISKVDTTSQSQYSFLILGYGLISDIDIMSESLRCMGEARLYAAAVYFIFKLRQYRGKLSMHARQTRPAVDEAAANAPLQAASIVLGTDVACYALPPLDQPLPFDKTTDIETSSSSSSSSSAGAVGGGRGRTRTSSWQGTTADLYRWITIESDFLLVWVVQTSHAAVTMHSGPGARLDDGVFTIFVVESASRCEMLQLLIQIDNGEHINHPKVQMFKANAYRLEPKTSDGLYTLDGENVEMGPIQGTLLPGLGRVMKT